MSKNVAQAGNVGYGATITDLERGHMKIEQPSTYDHPHPQREAKFTADPPKGFFSRSPYSVER